MLRKCVVIAALIFNAPIIWEALGPQTVGLDQAAIRFLITIPVAALLLGFLRIASMPPEDEPAAVPEPPARSPRTTVD